MSLIQISTLHCSNDQVIDIYGENWDDFSLVILFPFPIRLALLRVNCIIKVPKVLTKGDWIVLARATKMYLFCEN